MFGLSLLPVDLEKSDGGPQEIACLAQFLLQSKMRPWQNVGGHNRFFDHEWSDVWSSSYPATSWSSSSSELIWSRPWHPWPWHPTSLCPGFHCFQCQLQHNWSLRSPSNIRASRGGKSRTRLHGDKDDKDDICIICGGLFGGWPAFQRWSFPYFITLRSSIIIFDANVHQCSLEERHYNLFHPFPPKFRISKTKLIHTCLEGSPSILVCWH